MNGRHCQRASGGPPRLPEGGSGLHSLLSPDRAFDQERKEGKEAIGRQGRWQRGLSGTTGWLPWPSSSRICTGRDMVVE